MKLGKLGHLACRRTRPSDNLTDCRTVDPGASVPVEPVERPATDMSSARNRDISMSMSDDPAAICNNRDVLAASIFF